jgi:gamma-glutamyltranspeptidase/glutathione hydrolase
MQAAVASGHVKVTEAATEIIRTGGNAFDAVVAAGMASVVAEPGLTSLGGGGFLMSRQTSAPEPVLYDFFVDTPGRELDEQSIEPHFLPVTVQFPGSKQDFNVGHAAVAVPGILRGLLNTHSELGQLPLHEVIAPAVTLARQGLPLNHSQAYILGLLKPIMTLTAAGRSIFEPDGVFVKKGFVFKNPDLANFLEILPQTGDREFYEGTIAKQIVNDMQANGGLLTMADFAEYKIIKRKPLSLLYRGFQLHTNPPPSFGGSLLCLSLQLLQKSMLRKPEFGNPEHVCGLLTLMQHVQKQRETGALFLASGNADDPPDQGLHRIRRAFGGTTHISVLDSAGNAASLTCSNGEGSGYIVPGTGIMLNNMLGEDDLHPDGFHASPPGIRVASMMSPSVLMKNGRVEYVIGSGGSKRIRTAMLQVISNIIDFDMQPGEAVEAPRLHWDGEVTQAEPGFPPDSLTALQKISDVNRWDVKDVYFGGVHAVSATGECAGDSRRSGSAMVI